MTRHVSEWYDVGPTHSNMLFMMPRYVLGAPDTDMLQEAFVSMGLEFQHIFILHIQCTSHHLPIAGSYT